MTDLALRLADALGPGYAIERELGGGGMSRVFVATERALGRPVVVKVLPPDLASAVSVDRFRREIALAARLQHPHIVPLLAAGEGDELLWFTMPFVRGASLREVLANGPLPVAQAVTLAAEVADALAFAHREGVVHRDIKPENILVGEGHALVTDFGVARAVSEAGADANATGRLTTMGVALGTPAYMAPEQVVADPQMDARVDIYALGMVAYEMLAGRLPWTGLSPAQLMGAHLGTPPEPLAALRSELPAGLADVVMRALAKDPDARWPNAAAFRDALRGTLSGERSGAMRAGAAPSAPNRRTRIGVALALVAAAGSAGSYIATRDSSPVAESAERIAVLPFVPTSAGDAELTRLGRDLVVTVSSNLDRAGAVHTVDALTTLAQAGEAPITDEAKRIAIGRDLGVNGVLTGALVREGALVRLDYRLVPVTGTETPLQGVVRAAAGDVAALSDSLTWSVLRAVWRTGNAPTPSVAEATTKSLDALRAFLDGEQAVVRNDWQGAQKAFGRAFELDTTFVLAAYRLRWVTGWIYQAYPPRLDSVVVRGMASLPERDRVIAMADTMSDQWAHVAQLRRATELYPDNWPAWFRYADYVAHSGWFTGTSQDEAVRGFVRATQLNPELEAAYEHIVFTGKARDSLLVRRARAKLDTLSRRSGIMNLAIEAQFGHDTPLARSATVAKLLVDAARNESHLRGMHPAMLPAFPIGFASVGRPAIAIRTMQEIERRAPELVPTELVRYGSAVSWAVAGRWDSATTWMSRPGRAQASGGVDRLDTYVFGAIGSWITGADAGRARALRPSDADLASIPDTAVRTRAVAARAWTDGLLGIATGDAATVGAAQAALRAQRTPAAVVHLRSLTALAMGARGERAAAAESLWTIFDERLRSREAQRNMQYTHGIERVAGGRWLAEQRQFDRAQRMLMIDEWMVNAVRSSLFVVPVSNYATYERARAYEAAGDRDNAIDRYAQVLRAHELPESGDSAIVAESRRALERLRRGR